jgi:LPS sulfotransferase NodH
MPVCVGGPVDSYFVCGTPRTGSSLLLGLLESTGVAGHPQAYFREPDEPLWADRWRVPRSADGGFDYADYVRATLAAGRRHGLPRPGRGRRRAAGTGVRPNALCIPAACRCRGAGGSWLRAEQTGTWFIGGNGEIGGRAGNGRAPSFDAGRIGQLIQ